MQLRRAGSVRHHSFTPKRPYQPFNHFQTWRPGRNFVDLRLAPALLGSPIRGASTGNMDLDAFDDTVVSIDEESDAYSPEVCPWSRASGTPLIIRPRADLPVATAETEGKNKGGPEDQGSHEAQSRAEETHTVDPDGKAGREKTSEARERRGGLERWHLQPFQHAPEPQEAKKDDHRIKEVEREALRRDRE